MKKIIENPNYYGIIPANVRYDERLIPNAKLIYSEISALSNKEGFCWATNSYFAKLYKVSSKTVSNWISQLVGYGYLSSEIIYKENSQEIEGRYLRICAYPMEEKMDTPTHEKVIDNNTSSNNTSNNTDNAKASSKFSTLGADIIKKMESIDPKNKLYYKNTTQRTACEFLIKEYTFESVVSAINFYILARGKVKYLPSISTPCELRDKWNKLQGLVDRKLAENHEAVSNVLW